MQEQGSWADSIRTANPDDFWVWVILMLIAGMACGYGIFYFVRRARIIQDTPTSKIRSAAQGYVELVGKIIYFANQPVKAALTSRDCAWFRYQIDEKRVTRTKNGSQTSWHTIDEKISERVFSCEDETGSCMIDPRGAEVHPQNKDVWYGSSKWPTSGPTAKSGFFSSGRYRYTEHRLHSGEPLYALGLFRSIDPNKAHGDINNEVRVILKTWKQDQETLLDKFDANGDGQVDQLEWQQVRNVAEQKAIEQRLHRAARPTIHILGKTDDFRRPFILSVKHQEGMIKGFKIKAAACTVVFILLAPASIWMLIIRLTS